MGDIKDAATVTPENETELDVLANAVSDGIGRILSDRVGYCLLLVDNETGNASAVMSGVDYNEGADILSAMAVSRNRERN